MGTRKRKADPPADAGQAAQDAATAAETDAAERELAAATGAPELMRHLTWGAPDSPAVDAEREG